LSNISTPTLATLRGRGGKLVAFTPSVVELKPQQKLFPLDMLEWVQWYLKGEAGLEDEGSRKVQVDICVIV